jgi:hypothetical protein
VVPMKGAFDDVPTAFNAVISHKGRECGVVGVRFFLTGSSINFKVLTRGRGT